MGIGKAKELIYTAKVLSGSEAGNIGLAEHVVPQNNNGDAAYVKALEIATEICKNVRYAQLLGTDSGNHFFRHSSKHN